MSYFGYIPFHVRRSKTLSINSKILYAEITACLDDNGVFKHTVRDLSRWYNSNELAINRWLKELSAGGFIDYKSGVISMPRHIVINNDIESHGETNVMNKEKAELADRFIDEFNKLHGKRFMKLDPLRKKIVARLSTFTMDQLMTALNNRHKHVFSNKWYSEKTNIVHRDNIDLLVRNDAAIDKWLNFKDYNENIKDTARETIKADFSSGNDLLD